jgi:hypothetical protein
LVVPAGGANGFEGRIDQLRGDAFLGQPRPDLPLAAGSAPEKVQRAIERVLGEIALEQAREQRIVDNHLGPQARFLGDEAR